MKFTHQFDSIDCGPACARMVADHFGREYPLSYFRAQCQINREGVSVAGIRKALTEIGMRSATFELSIEELRSINPQAAILHWEQNHFVVLHKVKYNYLRRTWVYHIANPACGMQVFTEKDFARFWLSGNKGIVIISEPTDAFYARESIIEEHSVMAFARKYVLPFRHELGQLAFGLFSGIAFSLLGPLITQTLVDYGIGMRDIHIIQALLLAQIIMFVGSFTMGKISEWISLHMGTRLNINVLEDYLSKLLRLPMSFFETKSVGDYQQRIGDHGRLMQFTTQSSIQTLFSLCSASILLVIIGVYSLKILLVYLLLTFASIMWIRHFFKLRKSIDFEYFQLGAKNQNKMYELMSGIVDIKLNTYENYKINEWKSMQEELYRMGQKSLRLGQIQNTGFALMNQMRDILITYWIASEVVDGALTLGMMMSISSIIGQVGGPLSQLTSFIQQVQDARISMERSDEVNLSDDEDSETLRELPSHAPQEIALRGVTYYYPGKEIPALDDIDIDIPAGKMTAIVGESGSGKTTLLKLLMKFYRPTKGFIAWGDYMLTEYSAHSVRKQTGLVMQDNFVFSDTIQQNIILDNPLDEERLRKAIDDACLTDYISKLPLGVHTKIGANGIGISGGERQRVMIARAIYKRPHYLMLDEATSSLDAENEKHITDNIHAAFHRKTILVIAHRLSTVRNADNIIVLRHGKVVESGKHDELVAQRGYYYELIKNQLELAE